MNSQSTLESNGFVHVKQFLDRREIDGLLRFAESIGHGTGAGYFGKRLVTAIEDPAGIDRAVLDRLADLQRDLFGCDMVPAHSGIFSVDPNDPEHSTNFPFHQEHGSFYDFRDHFHYTNLYLVLDKEDPADSNVSVVPFSALRESDPELHELALGAGAARYTGNIRLDDSTGSSHTFRADIDAIAQTPELEPGDLLVLRGDIIHKTQNQKIRRTAISIRAVGADVVCRRERFDDYCGMKLAYQLGDRAYFGERDYIFESLGTDELPARRLQEERERLRRAAGTAAEPPALAGHIAAFSARLRELQSGVGQ
ncbi:phytanoyl-CoA dioxygenase family protein [Nocardia sp. NPDC057353]|uniref:phytanoyl-CoA dioxygenase family protein n=1 Tax=Nocardia sp. NPDC057353 TaxID=3346104 RepID=UPI003642B446